MERSNIVDQVKSIVSVYVKDKDQLAAADESASFLDDLGINSARLVDIVLEMEDAFDIEIDDDSVDQIRTIGHAVDVILDKTAA